MKHSHSLFTYYDRDSQPTFGIHLNSEPNRMEESAKHVCPFNSGSERKKERSFIKLTDFISGKKVFDTLHKASKEQNGCSAGVCLGSLIDSTQGQTSRPTGIPREKEEVKHHAEDFLVQFYSSLKLQDSPAHHHRLSDVRKTIEETGSYELTIEELTFGAKTAWRNAPRCVGRIQWRNLQVFDARHVQTTREMFEILVDYIKFVTNKGQIRSGIVVFPQRREPMKDFRVWNTQLIRYAGYLQADGSVVGDPANVEFTEVCHQLGWKGRGGNFDVLPLVLQANGQQPELFEIPLHVVLEVNIKHPRFPAFEELGLKWFALPAVSFMKLDCGGVEFPGCPFNGWYMVTEIVRDFVDLQRYNLLKPIATKLGLETSSNLTLWKDRALLELTSAILSSFQDAGVTLVDHHTVSDQFSQHMQKEVSLRGGTPADWVWIVPPVSSAVTSVFHQEMLNYVLKPSFDYQREPWKMAESRKGMSFKAILVTVRFIGTLVYSIKRNRNRVTILFATETGTSEKYATTLFQLFSQNFNARLLCMQNYSMEELADEQLVLVVTSTFGNGDSPMNGKEFASSLHEMHTRERSKTAPISRDGQEKESSENHDIKNNNLPLSKIRSDFLKSHENNSYIPFLYEKRLLP